MGWAGATHHFDGAVDVALMGVIGYVGRLTEAHKRIAVRRVYNIGWEDWDTQDESKYFDPYLKEYMHELGEISDPDDY